MFLWKSSKESNQDYNLVHELFINVAFESYLNLLGDPPLKARGSRPIVSFWQICLELGCSGHMLPHKFYD